MEKLKEKFKNHVLTEILNTEKIKVFEFRNKDGSGNNYQRWIIDRGTLIVTGDNYSSIYKWNDSNITLDFLAKCNLGYFNEKCQADKDGEYQKVYDEDYASNQLKEIASERIYDNGYEELSHIEDGEWNKLTSEEKFELVSPIICNELDIEEYELESLFYFENIYEVSNFLNSKENEFMFGINGWDYCMDIERLTMIPQIHLTALRVANEKYPNAF